MRHTYTAAVVVLLAEGLFFPLPILICKNISNNATFLQVTRFSIVLTFTLPTDFGPKMAISLFIPNPVTPELLCRSWKSISLAIIRLPSHKNPSPFYGFSAKPLNHTEQLQEAQLPNGLRSQLSKASQSPVIWQKAPQPFCSARSLLRRRLPGRGSGAPLPGCQIQLCAAAPWY